MPPVVVEELASLPANSACSHTYTSATVAQSDLVGFTKLSSTRPPQEVLGF